MSQLQVTGEAKIRDIQGPVIANSGVITALNGAANQYVRGDGTLASFPTSGGGGSSVSYYLNGSVNQGTFGGSTYYEMSEDAIIGAGTNFSASANGLIAQFITDVNVPDVTEIPSGNWNVEFFMGVSASSGALASFYVEIYKWDGTTFTLIATNVATPEQLTNTTTVDAYFTSVAMPTTALSVTDRLAVRIFVNVAGKTVTLYTEDNRLCQIVTTFSKGVTSINNLTDQSQYLTTGTSGTDFNIVSSGDTHTFNLPVASATNTGKLSSTDWSTFNNKVPYTGATGNVDLGTFNLSTLGTLQSKYVYIIGNGTNSGFLSFSQYATPDLSGTHTNSIYTTSNNKVNFRFWQSGLSWKNFNFDVTSLTAGSDRTYTMPDASGTLALTDDLSDYVPYTGATGNVDLGLFGLTSNAVKAIGDNSTYGGVISIKQNNVIGGLIGTGYTELFGKTNRLGISFGAGSIAYLSNSVLTAERTFTLPDLSGTLALLEGTQTFSGAKTFSAATVFSSTTTHTGVASFGIGSPTAIGTDGTLIIPKIRLYNSNPASIYSDFVSAATSNRSIVVPDASGTLALTSDIPSLSGYVPYTGATTNVDLGSNSITLFNITSNNVLIVKNTGSVTGTNGFSSFSGNLANNGFTFAPNNSSYHRFIVPTSSNYDYTLPSGSGTLALTSNLSAYLPLTGGTLTGNLTGTTAIFNGSVDVVNGQINLSNSYYLTARNNANNTFLRLIGRNSSDKVVIDTDGYGTILGGALSGTSAVFSSSVSASSLDASQIINKQAGTSPSFALIRNVSGYATWLGIDGNNDFNIFDNDATSLAFSVRVNTNRGQITAPFYGGSSNIILGANNSGTFTKMVIGTGLSFDGTTLSTTASSLYVPYSGATGAVNLGTNELTSGNVKINDTLYLKVATTYAHVSGYYGIQVGTNLFTINNSASTQAAFSLASLTTSRTFTLPDASGTLALTSNLSSYVPYTGATANVNLGANYLTTSSIFITGGSGTVGNLTFGQSDAFSIPNANNSSIDAITTSFTFAVTAADSTYKYFKFETTALTNNTLRSYTLPDASGTLALLSGTQTFSGATTFSSSLTMGAYSYASSAIQFTRAASNSVTPASGNGILVFAGGNAQMRMDTSNGINFDMNNGGSPYTVLKLQQNGNTVVVNSPDNSLPLAIAYQGTIHGYMGAASSALYAYSTNGGYVLLNASSVWVAASDAKRKRNFETYNLGLDAILGLKPKLYNMDFQKDGDEKQVGLVAQEVKEYIPQAFEQNEDFIGINYNVIIVTLVNAIQELETRIKQLENK